MKKYILFPLVLCLFIVLSVDADAQSRGKKRTMQKSGDFMENVWYGANIGLGFSGTGYESLLALELSPMAGYKFTPRFSVGPRVIFKYIHYRVSLGGPTQKYNFFDVGLGAFTRFKIIDEFFIHGEYNGIREQRINNIGTKTNYIKPHALLGLGYNGGGGEILILFDFLRPNDEIDLPIEFRIGYTVNF